jgi:hypothetical protein
VAVTSKRVGFFGDKALTLNGFEHWYVIGFCTRPSVILAQYGAKDVRGASRKVIVFLIKVSRFYKPMAD